MRYFWFVVLIAICLFANAYFSHAGSQPLGMVASTATDAGVLEWVEWVEPGGAHVITLDTQREGGPPAKLVPGPSSAAGTEIIELRREVERLHAAREGGDEAGSRMAIAAIIALVLKTAVSAFKKVKTEELTDGAKKAIPWIVAALGAVVAVLTHFAMGETWTNAIILGGGPPGAVLVHNLWETGIGLIKKPKPATGVVLVLLMTGALSGCCVELRGAVERHTRADRASARVTKEAAKRLREASCDAACREGMLRTIEAQADAVPPVMP